MHLSRFVTRYGGIRPGEHILYSVLHDRYIGIDDATQAALQRWCRGEQLDGAAEQETAQALAGEGFLVADRSEDDRALRSHLEKASAGIAGTMMVTLMPTLACNLACNYCFQKDSPAFGRMKNETEDASLEWILRTIDARALGTLHVHFFGGEPLTRKDAVLRAAEVLHASMRARGGKFEWSITTNGVSMDQAFVTAMRKHGDGTIKITFDGDKETHDAVRIFRNGRPSFEQIFANVVACAPLVRIRIGGNFLPGQGASYEKLLERLEAAGLSGKIDAVKFKPVIDVTRSNDSTCTSCAHESVGEVETLVQLNRSITKRKLGLGSGDALEGMLGPCELHWKNNYTIDPEGKVYKCPAVAGRPEMAVADVRDPATPEKTAPLTALRPWEQCGDCAFLPVCVGGCLGSQYLRTGRTDQVHCRKESFERSFRESVTQRYLAEFSEQEQGWETAA